MYPWVRARNLYTHLRVPVKLPSYLREMKYGKRGKVKKVEMQGYVQVINIMQRQREAVAAWRGGEFALVSNSQFGQVLHKRYI